MCGGCSHGVAKQSGFESLVFYDDVYWGAQDQRLETDGGAIPDEELED